MLSLRIGNHQIAPRKGAGRDKAAQSGGPIPECSLGRLFNPSGISSNARRRGDDVKHSGPLNSGCRVDLATN